MAQQIQRVETCGRQGDVHYSRWLHLVKLPLQDSLYLGRRTMRMHIEETIMVLHHRLPQLKHRVLMVRVVYLHPKPRLQPLVRLLLFAEEKDVDIPRRAMLRHRPCQRQPITLQKQHTHPPSRRRKQQDPLSPACGVHTSAPCASPFPSTPAPPPSADAAQREVSRPRQRRYLPPLGGKPGP